MQSDLVTCLTYLFEESDVRVSGAQELSYTGHQPGVWTGPMPWDQQIHASVLQVPPRSVETQQTSPWHRLVMWKARPAVFSSVKDYNCVIMTLWIKCCLNSWSHSVYSSLGIWIEKYKKTCFCVIVWKNTTRQKWCVKMKGCAWHARTTRSSPSTLPRLATSCTGTTTAHRKLTSRPTWVCFIHSYNTAILWSDAVLCLLKYNVNASTNYHYFGVAIFEKQKNSTKVCLISMQIKYK